MPAPVNIGSTTVTISGPPSRGPAAVPPGPGSTGTIVTTPTPIGPPEAAPPAVTPGPGTGQTTQTTATVTPPVVEQPVDTAGAGGGNTVVIGTVPNYIEVLADGTIIVQNATALNFTGTGVSITANGAVATMTIDSGGTLTKIVNGTSYANIPTANGNVTISSGGNIWTFATNGTLSAAGNITTTANISGSYILGNGSQLTGLAATYGNANVAANLAAFGSNPISTSGNITGGNIINSGISTVTGNITGGNLLTGGLISATGNITGGNVLGGANVNATTHTGTTVSVSANVTGGNILTGGIISAAGNVTGGNVLTAGILSATGNVTGNFFIGNGSQLTGLAATYGNANVVANLAALGTNPVSTTGNITGGNVLGGANVNATTHTGTTVSVSANITGGNILTGGIVSATANITGGNVLTAGQIVSTQTGNATTAAGQIYLNGTGNNRIEYSATGTGAPNATTRSAGTKIVLYPQVDGSGVDYGIGVESGALWNSVHDTTVSFKWYANTTAVATLTGTGNLSATGNITGGNVLGGANVNATTHTGTTVSVSANVTGGNVLTGGLISATGNITGGNVLGGANVNATTLTGTTVSVSANITGGNVLTAGILSATGNVTGNYFIGNGSQLTGITTSAGSSIVNGTSNVIVSASSNITANVTGNAIATFASTGQYVTGVISASGNITGGNVLGGANVNATTHTGTTVSVSANITGGNVLTGGLISATGNISGGNLTIAGNTATITTANYSIGYLNIPQISFSANATAALVDSGKHYYSTTSGNLALTIPTNATVAFPTGTALSLVVQASGNVLVNAAVGVTLYMGGNSTAGNRVVSAYGMATIMKVATDTWFINGTGVA